jgi:hypothetical protein
MSKVMSYSFSTVTYPSFSYLIENCNLSPGFFPRIISVNVPVASVVYVFGWPVALSIKVVLIPSIGAFVLASTNLIDQFVFREQANVFFIIAHY